MKNKRAIGIDTGAHSVKMALVEQHDKGVCLLDYKIIEQGGADMLMVKPGLPYLDVIARLRGVTSLPIAAYQVSGEYAMVKAAARNGWLDERACMTESLQAIARAGADLILTYAALEYARWWRESWK